MLTSSWTIARMTFCVFVVSFIFSASAQAAEGFELVPNGDMEKVTAAGQPVGWSTSSGKDGKAEYSVDTKVFHAGARSLKLQKNEKQGYCMWRSSYIPINVTEETEAELSVWIKAEDAPYLVVRIVTWDANKKFHQYLTIFTISESGFFDWKEYRKTITLKPGGVRMVVRLANFATGTVWFDDVKLIARKDIRPKSGKKPAAKPAAKPAPTSARNTAQGVDMFEFRNYIRNTRMTPPAGGNDLPLGWAIHNPPQGETIGAVTWVKGEPRPGFYSLNVAWKEGGHYIAAQPELVKRIEGQRPLRFQSYVKTTDGGKAYMLAECFDRAGKLIQEDKSDFIENAEDYTTCRLDFVSHPDTKEIRAYCVNGGTGNVLFHWVILEPNMELVKKMAAFPYTVSAEPAEGNRWWNGDRPVLHSFADSPVSASFAFWGDKSRLDNPHLIVEAPADLAMPEAFNLELRTPVNHAPAVPTTERLTRDGAPYVRYTFPGPDTLKRLQIKPYLMNHLTMCFIPKRHEPGREYKIYYHAENGNLQNHEKHFFLRILPALKKTPNPKRFQSYCWTLDDINYYDMSLVEKIARRFEEAALAGRERWTGGREEVHQVDQFLKKRGWFLFFETGDYPFRLSKVRAEDGSGKPGPKSNNYSPLHVIQDKAFFEEVVVPDAKGYYERAKVENGEFVFLDFEPGSIAQKYDFSARSRKFFAEKFNLPFDKVQTRRDILTNYQDEWAQYWAWMCDEIVRLHVKAWRQINPTLKHFFYCYPIWFNDPKATKTKIFNSPLDTRLNQRHFDVLGLSFYYITGKTAFQLMDINTKVLKTPVHMMPMMGTTTPYWGNLTVDSVCSPAMQRQQALIAASSGAKGFIPYQGKLMDGMYFVKLDQAMAEIAAVEDFYLDGVRADTAVTAKRLALAGPTQREDAADYFGMRVHKLGGNTLVTLFNFHRTCALTLRVASTKLAEGVLCEVPPLDVVFLRLDKQGK